MKSFLTLLKKTLLSLIIVSSSSTIFPKDVDVNTAKRVATNWFTEKADFECQKK